MWGLVLSGGAALGLANAGVAQVLEEQGYQPDCIAGASMGAIVGAIVAFTGNTASTSDLCKELTLWNVAKISENPLKDGLHGGLFRQRLSDHLESIFGNATIADCAIPFTCVAGRVKKPINWLHIVRTGFTEEVIDAVEAHEFDPSTRLLDALMASSAIPVVFSPYEIAGQTYIDLVHFGAIPARTMKEKWHPDHIIATDTVPTYEMLMPVLPLPWREFMVRGYEEIAKSKAVCDLVIKPSAPYGTFRFDKAADFVVAGREAAENMLPAISSLLND